MKFVAIEASPYKDGISSKITNRIIDGIKSINNQEIHRFRINEMNIRPCQGCFKCKQDNICIIQDDMHFIYPELIEAETIIISFPIFWWSACAQAKLFLDRLTAHLDDEDCLISFIKKNVILVITCKDKKYANSSLEMFEDFVEWVGIKLKIICVSESDFFNDSNGILKRAYEMGVNVV